MHLLLAVSAFFLLGVITRVKSRNYEQGDDSPIGNHLGEQDRRDPIDNRERVIDEPNPVIQPNEPDPISGSAGDGLSS